jgi:hypothetical protein
VQGISSRGWIAVLAVVAGLLAVPAFAGAADSAPLTDRPLAGPSSVGDVREYWTRERMREAAPLDLGLHNGARGADKPRATSSDAIEQPETNAYPNRVIGKIFATWPGVGDITCSGSVINTETDSFVITASHCLFEDGVFFTNVTFVPGYRQGTRPFGEFPGVQLSVPRLVALGSQLPNDHGSIIVAPSAGGQSVEDAVGSFGISLFGSPNQSWRAYGYPADPPFDGERLFTCDSPTTILDATIEPAGIGIDCEMTAGASGGPWVIAGTTLVASNISYTIPDELPGVLFGPQFADSAAALFDSAHPVRCGRKLASIVGTEESDRLVATSGPDVILGDRGNDTIVGKGGRDKLCGEEGRDKLKGGGGKDLCDGGPSRDRAGRCEKEKRVAG